MNQVEFEHALRLGLGRVIQHLQQHDAAPYLDLILHACLHDLNFDRQLESSRAPYLFEIIQLTDAVTFFRAQILGALSDSAADDYDREQVFELALPFAQQDNREARNAMHAQFARNAAIGDDIGARELIRLDGIRGLLFVAEQLGAAISTASYGPYELFINEAEELIGKTEVSQALTQAAENNAEIRAYVNAVMDYHHKRNLKSPHEHKRLLSYEQLKQAIVDHSRWSKGAARRWGWQATEVELQQAAADLSIETDPDCLKSYLRIFHTRPFPLDLSILLRLAQSEDNEVVWGAAMALEQLSHPEVRALALEWLNTKRHLDLAVGLLVKNFHEGDYALIDTIVAEINDLETLHALGIDVKHVVAANPSPAATSLLIALCEQGPCTQCRWSFVEQLIDLRQLPEWMMTEYQFDANIDIRALITDYGKTRAVLNH